MIHRNEYHADNGDGWRIGLRQVVDDEHHNPAFRPVAIVPGYGMNTFLFGYHPAGRPLEEYLAEAGFEVWSIAFRANDGAFCDGGSRDYCMRDVAVTDLNVAFALIERETCCRARGIDAIGCSLGGTMLYAHLALVPDSPVHAMVALGAPLRWVEINPLVKAAFSSPWLARRVKLRGVRKLAGVLLPALEYVPFALAIYIHPNIVDMSAARTMVQSVEDPNPVLNEELVRWIRARDLIIDGVNVTEAVRDRTNPLLVLTGNADGIVPLATARFPLDWMAAERKDLVVVGDDDKRYAHADLYVSRYSHDLVFAPLAEWLRAGYAP